MCKQCEKNPVYEFTNKRKLCKQCFVRYFHKKFLYIIRKFGMVRQSDVVQYKNDGGFRGVGLDEMLKMFSERAHVKLVKKGKSHRSVYPKLRSKGAIRIAIDSTLDSEAEEIVHARIKKDAKKLKVPPVEGKIIRPLYLFLDKEVLLYAKIRRLKFNEKKVVKDKVSKFVDLMEETHPEVKRAIVNSYLKLYD